MLSLDDKEYLALITVLKNRCLSAGVNFLYRATIERSKAPYEHLDLDETVGHDAAVNIATRKLDLRVDDPNEIFEPTDTCIPYWGHNFLWPSDERYMIYSNGDNAAFIAGDRDEIESLLGVTYGYCMERFAAANASHLGWTTLATPYAQFCEEFAAW